ncbi:alcohol dehydrogenase catalytic domain-containing protein [Pseudomonas saponiphila]|uniref:alcohol dehydrogenase catalytic domain-containing protein n=1 Tax=Pseudomonas saponiphila TaxID=556534 RepID=UPI002AD2E62D|nr:alcohol dehydrogenase catalytic domain-containing protein [Pseudomonas saponiphila]
MCYTDMIIRDQYYPIPLPVVLGHEGTGIVESAGPQVKHLQVGDHMVLTYGSCGHCMPCAGGLSSYCKELYNLNFSGVGADGIRASTHVHKLGGESNGVDADHCERLRMKRTQPSGSETVHLTVMV